MSYLEDVPEEKVFFLGEKTVRNLYGLLFEFRNLSDETYNYYAGEEHNYFADWIEFVVGYKELADAIRKSKTRDEGIVAVEKAIEKLISDKDSGVEIQQVVIETDEPENKGDAGAAQPAVEEPKSEETKEASADSGLSDVHEAHHSHHNHHHEAKIDPLPQEEKAPILPAFEEKVREPENQEAVETKPAERHIKVENKPASKAEPEMSRKEENQMLKKISQDEKEIRDFLWKHFAWDMAKEFMYGMALGILIGLVLSKVLFRQ